LVTDNEKFSTGRLLRIGRHFPDQSCDHIADVVGIAGQMSPPPHPIDHVVIVLHATSVYAVRLIAPVSPLISGAQGALMFRALHGLNQARRLSMRRRRLRSRAFRLRSCRTRAAVHSSQIVDKLPAAEYVNALWCK
jgi:hypothetical protein